MSDLISRAAAIAVADSSDYVGLSVDDVKKVTDEVIKGLKRLPSAQPERYWIDSEGNISALPSAQPEQRWIPCSERLPDDESRSYWVCTDNGYQHECRWTNINPIWTNLTTDWRWNIFDIPQYSKVIAWMPLPEPYKERRNDEADYRKE